MSERTPEGDTLRKMCARLNESISSQVPPARFADHLVSAGFISQHTAQDWTSVGGYSDYQKISNMVSAVSDNIKSFGAGNRERVTQKFNKFVILLSDEFGLTDLAEQLVKQCSTLDSKYTSPLPVHSQSSEPSSLQSNSSAAEVETVGAAGSGNSATTLTVTLQELLAHVGISEDTLKQRCSDERLLKIADEVDNWEVYAPYLGLSPRDTEDLKDEYRKSNLRSSSAFRKWKERAAFKATYHYLVVDVFLKYKNASMAEFVCKLLK